MIKKRTQVLFAMIAIVAAALAIGPMLFDITGCVSTGNQSGGHCLNESFLSSPDPVSCTIFTVSHGQKVFFGNNEDWKNLNTYYWTIPSDDKHYGVVYFGFGNFRPQGGINEKGLAFDINALPRSSLNPHPELPKVRNPFYEFLKTCATVDDVIEKIKIYSWERSWKAQLHVADKMGNAVVISAGKNGEIAFTRKKKKDRFLVSTNFNLANPENGKHPCWRYTTASRMLEQMGHKEILTPDYFRSILDAVHVEGAAINTVYSNIFDLTNGIIYLYHWHHYGEVVELNVAEAVTNRIAPIRIRDLFSQQTVELTSTEFRSYQKTVTIWNTVVWIWIILAGMSVIALIGYLVIGSYSSLVTGLAWVLVVALCGPFGLIAHLYTCRPSPKSLGVQPGLANWKPVLGETLFDVTGHTIGIILALSSFYLILPLNESSLISIVARCYGLPLIVGMFFFKVPVSAFTGGRQYWLIVRGRIPTAIISLNVSLTGMLPVSGIFLVLAEKHLGMNGPGNPIFWGVISLGAFSGVLTLYPFNAWRVHRSFYFWSGRLLAIRENKREMNVVVPVPPDKTWGAILLSVAFLSGVIILLLSFLP
jgi:uncharacterized protein DUF4396/acyl-CoA:6-aminopenicillanic acid acyl transferase